MPQPRASPSLLAARAVPGRGEPLERWDGAELQRRERAAPPGLAGLGTPLYFSCCVTQAPVELWPNSLAVSNRRSFSKASGLDLKTPSDGESSTFLAQTALTQLNILPV